jgi:transcriptional antiterminator
MKTHWYLDHKIFETLYDHLNPKIFIVQLDMSEHNSLTSAQCHLDYLLK